MAVGGGLFGPTFTTPAMSEAVGDRAWVQAMLDVEAALARAEEGAGVVPPGTAAAVAGCCVAERFDVDAIGVAAAEAGNPVIPLVAALAEVVPGEAAGWVHWGATSQDVLDTATMLLVRRGLALVSAELGAVCDGCAVLAERHRGTPMLGRTLLQPAVPITFGLKAAGWLVAVLDARASLDRLRAERLASQLGGAAGTLASLGAAGPEVARRLAEELGLGEPVLPWHTARGRVAEVAGALGVACGVLGKVALDVALLMQGEVGEAAEPAAPGRGGSSAMPHKRNPVASVAVLTGVRRAHGLVGVLLGAMVQEHERAAGGWQAEWVPLGELLELTAGAASRTRQVVEGLEVDAARMRANLDAAGGLPLAERLSLLLAARLGRRRARALVEVASRRAAAGGRLLRDELLAEPEAATALSPAEVEDAFDPARYLGSTEAFVDRALAAHRAARAASK